MNIKKILTPEFNEYIKGCKECCRFTLTENRLECLVGFDCSDYENFLPICIKCGSKNLHLETLNESLFEESETPMILMYTAYCHSCGFRAKPCQTELETIQDWIKINKKAND